jgi:BlaI family penicillinase repressor
MARKRTPTLTETELRLMDVVWDRGEATVHDVIDALPAQSRPAYNTVLTTMRILEMKGYLGHDKRGRAHVYKPLVSRDKARRKALRHIVRSFYDNSAELLMLNMIEEKQLSRDEIERLRVVLEKLDRS